MLLFFPIPSSVKSELSFLHLHPTCAFEGHVDLDHVKEIKVEERASGGLGIFIN